MEHQDTLTDVQIADHDVKINMLERTSYDGTFFWKIEDFGRLLQDAISGRCLSIYSPQFYVCRYGYKVLIILELNLSLRPLKTSDTGTFQTLACLSHASLSNADVSLLRSLVFGKDSFLMWKLSNA